MSWCCPHQEDDRCRLRKKKCKTLTEGCVLTDKVELINKRSNADEKFKNSGKHK